MFEKYIKMEVNDSTNHFIETDRPSQRTIFAIRDEEAGEKLAKISGLEVISSNLGRSFP